MVSVEDRTAATLIPIIMQYILPGTKVMSDSYEEEGYSHSTVNHSLEFVNSETGDHSTWRVVKRSLPRSGTVKHHYNSFFAEFMFRRQYYEDCHDRF